jgi:AraC-like DNA-binding protein
MGAYLPLPALLEQSGIALGDVLAATGLDASIFEDADNLISLSDAARLLQVSAELANCDHMGLLVGQRVGLSSLGLAGQAALCAATVGDGLRNLSAHFQLHNTGAIVSLVESGRSARLVYAVVEPGMGDTRQLQQGTTAAAFNVLRQLCGPEWLPTLVTIAGRAPANPRECHRFFQAPLSFDAPESAIVFESRWLEQALPAPSQPDELEAALRARWALHVETFPAGLRRVVRREMLVGELSMDHVARLLNMQRRTLARRLEQEATTFSGVVEATKRDVACQLLRETRLPIQQIADYLNYSSAANFSTAFRRWTGVPPRTYRGQAN